MAVCLPALLPSCLARIRRNGVASTLTCGRAGADMTRTSLLVWVTGLAIGTCACATSPETQIVNDAAAALGGRDRVLAVKTLLIDGEGTNWNVGQDMTPEATSQAFIITGYRRAI